MVNLDQVTTNLINAKSDYLSIAPGWPRLIAHQGLKRSISLLQKAHQIRKQIKQGTTADQIVAGLASGFVMGKVVYSPLGNVNKKAHVWASHHSGDLLIEQNGKITDLGEHAEAKGSGSYGWIDTPGRQKMVIIYHNADRAGPHIDIHIGALSVIYRVKPDLQEQLKFNRAGALTNSSKELVINHIRNEIAHGARAPQNSDHPSEQATYQWLSRDLGPVGYGQGSSRQVVSISEVEIYKAYEDGPIEFFAPALNPNHALYLYRIYPGSQNRAPIIIWGEKKPAPPEFPDRLHLKMVDPKDLPKWESKLDMKSSTAKYDGSSVYLHVTPKGTRAYSPRISKRSGHRIEYTPKLNGLAAFTMPDNTIAMGEIMMYRSGRGGKKIWLPHSEAGGILNGHNLIPEGVKPMIVIYRVDKVGRKDTSKLDFWTQRSYAQALVDKDPENFMLPELMSPEKAKQKGFEGVVIANRDQPITQAIKTKYWEDACDWRIDKVDFQYSEKGNISGVVHFTSLESGKKFKLGPGGIGDRATCEAMMADPELYVGSVMKVRSRHGHEGRAAKVLEEHLDKGLAPF